MAQDVDQEQVVIPKVSIWTRLRFMLSAYLVMGLVRLVLGLFTLIKWAFAPLALLFGLVVILPFGRFSFKMKEDPGFAAIASSDLPTSAWCYFEEISRKYQCHGFSVGNYLANEDLFADQMIYAMTMTNHELGMGVGFLYIKMRKAKDDSFDNNACEFTCVKEGTFIDLTNNYLIEPFLPMPGRIRIILDTYSDEQMFYIARQLQESVQCRSNDKMLELLESSPELLMNDEVRMARRAHIARGYIYKEKRTAEYKLTWKGAWISAWQTLWPTSILYRKKIGDYAHRFLKKYDIDPDRLVSEIEHKRYSFAYDGTVSTLADAFKIVGPVAVKKGFEGLPVSIGVSMSNDDGKIVIDSFDVNYERIVDYPERKMRWRASLFIQLDNSESLAMLAEDESALYTYEQYEDYEFEDNEPLTGEPDKLLPLEQIINSIHREAMEQPDGYMTLMMQSNRPVWKITDYGEEEVVSLILDPQTGELIAREVEQE